MTEKEQIFVDLLPVVKNRTEAARIAGYAHPGIQASQVLERPHIQSEIEKNKLKRAMRIDSIIDKHIDALDAKDLTQSNLDTLSKSTARLVETSARLRGEVSTTAIITLDLNKAREQAARDLSVKYNRSFEECLRLLASDD